MDVAQNDLARRAFLSVSIGGHDATSFLEPYLLSFEYSDQAEGKSDEISMELHDRDGKWLAGRLFSKGTGVTASIRCLNWWGPGQNLSLDCGKGTCDEVSVSGPPTKVSIKAVSASLYGPLRDTRHTRAWEAFTLQEGVAGGPSAAQSLMGHSRATTTDIYVRSAGLYADQGAIIEALSKSVIGKAVSGLMEKEMPPEIEAPEAFCTQGHVHSMLH